MWLYRRGDPAAAGPAGNRSWQRVRLVTAGTLAASVSISLALLTTQRMADLLGVTWSALARHAVAQTAVIGAITLVTVTLLAALAGLWPLAGAVTAAVAQVAVLAPVILTLTALYKNDPLRWLAALAGAALGAAVAGSRWRVPLAAALTVLAAMALFIAYGATTGDPQKLAVQLIVIPSVLILVLCAAAGGAVVGATAPVPAARGALPAVLGPLAGTLAVGGLQATQVISVGDGEPLPFNPQITSATLLLLAGAASTGGGADEDLRGPLQALAAPAVEVATPAQAVKLPSGIATEVVAAVRAALDNVRKHAGADARAWILLEDEQDGVRVSVRDDGVGFPPERPAEAAEAGRLGIAQSMRGRIADCGGTTTIDSRPGQGTEVEFWVPRVSRTRR